MRASRRLVPRERREEGRLLLGLDAHARVDNGEHEPVRLGFVAALGGAAAVGVGGDRHLDADLAFLGEAQRVLAELECHLLEAGAVADGVGGGDVPRRLQPELDALLLGARTDGGVDGAEHLQHVEGLALEGERARLGWVGG